MIFRVGLDEHHTMIISRNLRFINAVLGKFGLIFNLFFGIVQTNRRFWKIFDIQNRRIFFY